MRSGFSLLELSIVLVIIGLLAGGVMTGQALIRAAEMRSLISSYHTYRTATYSFRDKYNALPGDFNNATKFWGISAGTGRDATCFNSWSNTAVTCDGDGDGLIGVQDVTANESFRFWQHLANAGLIGGTYRGRGITDVPAMYGCDVTLCGETKITNGMMLPVATYSNGTVDFIPFPLTNFFYLGNIVVNNTINQSPIGALLTTEEAWNFDTKIDDGLPYVGSVQSFYRAGATQWAATNNNACASSATIAGATYNLSRTGLSCSLRIAFR